MSREKKILINARNWPYWLVRARLNKKKIITYLTNRNYLSRTLFSYKVDVNSFFLSFKNVLRSWHNSRHNTNMNVLSHSPKCRRHTRAARTKIISVYSTAAKSERNWFSDTRGPSGAASKCGRRGVRAQKFRRFSIYFQLIFFSHETVTRSIYSAATRNTIIIVRGRAVQ